MRGREQLMRQGHTPRPAVTPSCALKGLDPGERRRDARPLEKQTDTRADAERFIEQVQGDDPDSTLRIEERELETGGVN